MSLSDLRDRVKNVKLSMVEELNECLALNKVPDDCEGIVLGKLKLISKLETLNKCINNIETNMNIINSLINEDGDT